MKQETGQLISSIDKMVICMLYKYTQFQFMQICNEHSNCCPCRYKMSHSVGALSHCNVHVLYLQSAGHVIGCSVDKALP